MAIKYTLCRLVAIALLWGMLFSTTSIEFQFFIFTPIALSHYLISYFYSRKIIKTSTSTPGKRVVFAVTLVAAIVAAYFNWPKMGWAFGVHFALSEVYMFSYKNDHWKTRFLVFTRLFLNFFVYVRLIDNVNAIRSSGVYLLEDLYYWDCTIVVLIGLFIVSLSLARDELNRSQLFDTLVFELVTIGFFGLSFFQGFKVILADLILYHFLLWLILPLVFRSFEKSFVTKFFYQNVILLAGFSIIGLVFHSYIIENYSSEAKQSMLIGYRHYTVIFLGYIHIIMTPFMSRKNPVFINRWLS